MSTLLALPRSESALAWRRLAVVLWVLILVGGFARGLVRPTSSHIGIYSECAKAGQHWLASEPLYPPEWAWTIFPYGPLLAVGFVPLSCLPDSLGSGIWRVLLGLAYLAALNWWARAALPRSLSISQRAFVFLLVIPLTAPTVLTGQVGGLVAAAVFASLAAAAEERWNWSALFVVLACLLKAYPVAVALLLGASYPRPMTFRLLVAAGLALAAPFLFQRPDYVVEQYGGWFNLLVHGDRHDWPLNIANRNLSLLFRVWLVPMSPWLHLALQLLTAAGVAGLCLLARQRGWPRRQVLLALLGLAGFWMTLFGPVVESYTYILIGPTLAWLLIDGWEQQRPIVYQALLATSWGIFTAASMSVWFMRSTALHNLGPHPLAGLLLLLAFFWELGRQFRASEHHPDFIQHRSPGRLKYLANAGARGSSRWAERESEHLEGATSGG
jgi:hypothetical protein